MANVRLEATDRILWCGLVLLGGLTAGCTRSESEAPDTLGGNVSAVAPAVGSGAGSDAGVGSDAGAGSGAGSDAGVGACPVACTINVWINPSLDPAPGAAMRN